MRNLFYSKYFEELPNDIVNYIHILLKKFKLPNLRQPNRRNLINNRFNPSFKPDFKYEEHHDCENKLDTGPIFPKKI